MQNRCREKKKIGGATEKKSIETKEKDLNGTIDENENGNASSGDEHDNSGVTKEEISPKRNAQRTAKVKVTKYDEENDEDDDSIIHGMELDDDNESDYMGSDSETEKKIKRANTKPKQPRKPRSASNGTSPVKKKAAVKKNESDVVTDSQQNGDESSPKAKTEKPKKPRAKKEPGTTPKKEPKKTAKRPKPADSDDEDEDFPILSNPPTPTKKARTQRGAAAKKSYRISDDDDDDEDYV